MQKICLLLLVLHLWLDQTSNAAARILKEHINVKRINCTDRDYISHQKVHSHHWVLVNYIRADHGKLRCDMNITYTTYADYRYLNNVVPLLERWQSPLSIALYASGTDFEPTVQSILWLRQCDAQAKLVLQWVSLHIYFDFLHMPPVVEPQQLLLERKIDCNSMPDGNIEVYRMINNLDYPVNTGRNIAKEAALTHYVLASDIELYPSPGLAAGFMQMLGHNTQLLDSKYPIVFPLNLFEVELGVEIPKTKSELQFLLATKQAVPFHKYICPDCQNAPRLRQWINSCDISAKINVFHIANITAKRSVWEPTYIGTIKDPPYDELLTWEGLCDKLTQVYELCFLEYKFHILDNAFMVHKPGIKKKAYSRRRMAKGLQTLLEARGRVTPEFLLKYGRHSNCVL